MNAKRFLLALCPLLLGVTASPVMFAQEAPPGFWGVVKFENGNPVPDGTPVWALKDNNPACDRVLTRCKPTVAGSYCMSYYTLRDNCGFGQYTIISGFYHNNQWYQGQAPAVLQQSGGQEVNITVYLMDDPQYQGP